MTDEDIDFEKAMKRLKDIVSRLNTENVPLDETIRLFEEGVHLARSCRALLDRARVRIENLTQDLQDTEREHHIYRAERGIDPGGNTDDDG